MTSIAKYTSDYTHLERCTPSIPEPEDANTPMEEVFKVLESPKQYYATVADSIPPAQQARIPTSNANKMSNSIESLSSSPPRLRKASTQIYAMTGGDHNTHISGHEPRAFPGAAFQRERRRSIRKGSISASDGTADLSTSQQLDSGLAKVKEGQAVDERDSANDADDSD